MSNSESLLNQCQNFIEEVIDKVIDHEPEKIKEYVDEFRLRHSKLSTAKIAQKILDDQATRSGFLGAITGLGGFITLPAAIPIDLAKYLRIQAYTVCCFSYLYDYPLDRPELKTDLFLILSHSSFDKLKEFVCSEAQQQVKDDHSKKEALKKLRSQFQYKKNAVMTSVQVGQRMGVKCGSKLIINVGGKTIRDYALRDVPKVFRGIIWRLGGRKIAEKTLQKTIGKVVPVFGAVIGGGVDWWMTQSVGKVGIEYYEGEGPDFLDAAYSLVK